MAAENITIARPYAKALFAVALKEGELQKWSDALAVLAQVSLDDSVVALLGDPRITAEKLLQLYLDVGQKVLDKQGENFLRLLASNQRLQVLPEIAHLYEIHRAEAEKTIDVKVSSFMPLSDLAKDKLAASLSKRLGLDVHLTCTVDESLLGGAIIQANDLVMDGSVRGKLKTLAEEMIS